MTDDKVAQTDPARELTELLAMLQSGDVSKSGAQYLADMFGVTAWSPDFHRIIIVVMDRLAELVAIVEALPLDDDYRGEMIGHVNEIATAFSPSGYQNAWSSFGLTRTGSGNVQPLKMLSPLVRQQVSYPRLSDEQLDEVSATVTELIGWLEEHQLSEQDFIRQALIGGLRQTHFRLSKFRWLGWGYTVASLQDVVAAYMMLERQSPDLVANPDAGAVLAKVGAGIKEIYGKLQAVKTAAEAGDWLLRAYVAADLIYRASPSVRGLLSAG